MTNRLLSCVRLAEKGDKISLKRARDTLLDGHVRIARSLCPPPIAERALEFVHGTLRTHVDDVCAEVLGSGKAIAAQQDMVSTVGEKWSTKIMAEYMSGVLGANVAFVDAGDVIVTDGVAGDSKVLLPATQARSDIVLAPLLSQGVLPLMTGFYGASASGMITTLGRGGSDLSAAVMGYCLSAGEIVLYKVEYTKGPEGWLQEWAPGWVGIAHCADSDTTIPLIHYEEARELAHFAKAVLHPDTVFPAILKNIPIIVKNSLNPSLPGTAIVGGAVATSGAPRARTVTRTPLAQYESKQFPLDALSLPQWSPQMIRDAFLVAVVGLEVMRLPGARDRMVASLKEAGILHTIPHRVNGSFHNLTAIVPGDEQERTLQLFHKVFIKQQ